MHHHQFTLQPYTGPASRYTCPACGKPKCFKRYINTQTRQPVSDTTGKCDREVKCGYHQTPKQYFESTGMANHLNVFMATPPAVAEAPPSFIDAATLKASRTGYDGNCLLKFLCTVFDAPVVNRLIDAYQIGSSAHWPGATVFWQIDLTGHIRTGKIMLYNASTGRRVREPFSHIAWAHKALNLPDYNLKQCLFGEHLLHKHPDKPVALVESEKTALIASVYFPQLVWLATGSLQGLTEERCRVLAGKKVTLYPDLKGYDKWQQKTAQISHLCNATTSNFLESVATPQQINDGWDIADYLLTRHYKDFLANQADALSSIVKAPVHTPAAPVTRKQKFWQPPVESSGPRGVCRSGVSEGRPCGMEGNSSGESIQHSAGSCKATDPARTEAKSVSS